MAQSPTQLQKHEIKVVPYSEEYSEAQRAFALAMWPSKRRRRESSYLRWKFRGPPQGDVSGLLLAVARGEVRGQLGLIPALLRSDGEVQPCQWACDLMVDSSLRRMGVGSLLFGAAMERDVVTLGSNPSALADMTMSRLGFQPLIGPRIMVLPVRLEHVLGWVTPGRFRKAIPLLAALGQPVATFRYRSLSTATAVQALSSQWRDVVSVVEARQATLKEPHIVHDQAFMEWRCSGLNDYAAELDALRTDNGCAVVGPARNYYYVYEWFAPNREEFLALFSIIVRKAKSANCQTVQALAHTVHEEQWLRDVGFLGMRHRCKIITYPPEKLSRAHQRFHYCVYDSDGNL